MSTRISSRLARRQQNQMLRQTVLYVVAAIGLGVLFIFFILPRSINLFFTLTSGTQDALTASPGVPPQVPVFSAPLQATSSATVKLNGFGQANTEVVMVVNSEQKNREKVNDDGTFSIEVELEDGENMVGAFAVDDKNQESALSQTYTIIKDTQPPKLEIEQPQDNQTIELRKNQTANVSGKTDPGSQVQLNGRSIYVGSDGSFSSSYQLQEGDNMLDFVAHDLAGNRSQKTIKVTFRF